MGKILKPTSVIKADLGINEGGAVQRFFTHTCLIHMDKYIPYKSGDLRNEFDEGVDYIEYNMPYAHYMYEGTLYVDPETGSSWARKNVTKVPTSTELTYRTAWTGHHWDERMWSAEKNQVISKVQEYINRRK